MSDTGGAATIRLEVITPGRLLVDTDVDAVFLPSLEGEIGILPGHRPLFVGIGRGRIRYVSGSDEEAVPVCGGYAQVQPEKVVVMTEVGTDEEAGGTPAS
jgi:F-type H+-transporting ATPase subunit epsilon